MEGEESQFEEDIHSFHVTCVKCQRKSPVTNRIICEKLNVTSGSKVSSVPHDEELHQVPASRHL